MDGLELHEFDAGAVGVVEGQLEFAVDAEDLGVLAGSRLPTASFETLLQIGDADDSGGDMVGAAEFGAGGLGWIVEHVFDPIGAVGHLHHDPIGAGVGVAALPVEVEAEEVFVEAVHGSAIANDISGVDDVGA